MNLQQEYEEQVKKYKELESLISRRIAGTLDMEIIPDDTLKQVLLALGFYVKTLEQALKYNS